MFHAYPPHHNAGAEWMAHTMLRHLVQHGHEVDVLLSREGPASDFQGVRVHPFSGKGDPFRFLPSADLIVTHLENTPRATVLGHMNDIPVVHVLHNTFEPSKQWASRPGVSLIVANSEWMRDDYAAWFAATERAMPGCVVVRPPVDAAEYRTTRGDMVTMVNLFENKGAAVFWRIADALPDVKFLAVRGGYGEQVIPDVVPPNVELVPNTPHMRDDVYARTRILLMPSDYESWGRVGVEAMASGIPVVAHATPGLRESLGFAGIFADRDNPQSFVDAIRALDDKTTYTRAAEAALRRSSQLDPATDLRLWEESLWPMLRR
jgi:glycosyltransferase involved in cell wall biosynthesis